MPSGRKPNLILPVAVTVAAPILYPLSIGPAMWLFQKAGWQHPSWQATAAEAIYIPVVWVAEATGTLPVLAVYLGWFID